MSAVRSDVETSISNPISNTASLNGRVNPKTTLVCLEFEKSVQPKSNQLGSDWTSTGSPNSQCFSLLGGLSV